MIIAALKLDPLPLCCVPPKVAAKATKAVHKLGKGIRTASSNADTFHALLDGISALNSLPFVPCAAFAGWRANMLNQMAGCVIEVAAALKTEDGEAPQTTQEKRRKAAKVH